MNDHGPIPVHQLLLGLKAREGVSLIGHSMASDGEALSWQRRLEQYQRVRLLPWITEPPPDQALSYYRFGDDAVILRRWAAGGSIGRSDAHALIGPADVLTVPVALGLDRGFDWRKAAASVTDPLFGHELVSAAEAETTIAELRAGATRTREMLRRTLGRLIDSWAKPLTIIGCPDEDRVALTWGLVYIGSGYLAQKNRKSRSWTFSTYEIEDSEGDPNLPEILFLPGKPIGRGVASRESVDVRYDGVVSPKAGAWSEALVNHFISGAPLPPEFNDQAVISGAGTVPISVGPLVQREPVSPPEPPTPDPEPDQKSPPPPVTSSSKVNSKKIEKELDDLRRSRDEPTFRSCLAGLGYTGYTADARAEIRRIISVDDYLKIIVAITAWYRLAGQRDEQFQRLLTATFGPNGCDLAAPDATAFVAQLIEHPGAPDFFVYRLVDVIDENRQLDRVVPVLAARCRAQHDPAREPTGVARYRRGTASASRSGAATSFSVQRGQRLATAGLVVLMSLFFMAVGYFIGAGTSGVGPKVEGTPAAQPTVSGSQGGQPGTEAREPVTVSGGVARELTISGPWQAAGDKTVVFPLLQPANDRMTYRSQGECRIDAEKNVWVCENVQLTMPPNASSPETILVVKISPQDKQRYQRSWDTKKPLEGAPPNLEDVIFTGSERH